MPTILKGHPIAPAPAAAIPGHVVHAAPASISHAAYAAARKAAAAHIQWVLVPHYASAHAAAHWYRVSSAAKHAAAVAKGKAAPAVARPAAAPSHYVPAPGAIVAGAHQGAGLPVYYGGLKGVLAGVAAFAPSGVLLELVVPASGPAQWAPLGALRLARLA